MNLRELVSMRLDELREYGITAAKRVEAAREAGFGISGPALSQYRRGNLRSYPDPDTIRALAFILKVDVKVVALAALNSIGLRIRVPWPEPATTSRECGQCGTRHGESSDLLVFVPGERLNREMQRRWVVAAQRMLIEEYHRFLLQAEGRAGDQERSRLGLAGTSR